MWTSKRRWITVTHLERAWSVGRISYKDKPANGNITDSVNFTLATMNLLVHAKERRLFDYDRHNVLYTFSLDSVS